MAVAPTGAIYKALEFDGVSSRTYGVYITGAAVYNAPERAVEMITIPGRNGAFALDNGRFENIEVSYPAGIFADTEADFAEAVSDFRNFLCSRNGYVRLQDDYNPNEYRMAVYKSGLDVKPAQLRAGEFNIVFECKPQRFLTSGEAAQTIAASGDTVTNPTLFDARPLLEVTGYGDIGINDETVTVLDSTLGEIRISEKKAGSSTGSNYVDLDVSKLNAGDEIYDLSPDEPYIRLSMKVLEAGSSLRITVNSVTDGTAVAHRLSSKESQLIVTPTLPSFVKGTASSVETVVSVTIQYGATIGNFSYKVTTAYEISGGSERIKMTAVRSGLWPTSGTQVAYTTFYDFPAFYGNSTKALTPPMYIDLDIGESYGELVGEEVSCNNLVVLPAKLPTLPSGSNIITFDNTITDLKIVPRWWKI